LGPHEPGHLCRLDGVTLGRPVEERPQGIGARQEPALRRGLPGGDVLLPDLDDPRRPVRLTPAGRADRLGHASSSARNSRTFTCEPAAMSPSPAGITARPFALVTVDSRFDPAPPVLVARHRPWSRDTRTLANCMRSWRLGRSSSSTATISGRNTSRRPIILSTAGRMNSSKLTNTETGLPG